MLKFIKQAFLALLSFSKLLARVAKLSDHIKLI